jgi:hypothetical protein
MGPRTLLSNGTFGGFGQLVSVDALRSNLAHLPNYCFENCKALTRVDLPASLLSIGDGAFYSCTSLQNLELLSMKGLATIGYAAFMFCKALRAIRLPVSVQSIGEAAFSHCSLIMVDLAPLSSLKTIPAQAFANCTSLTNLTFPNDAQGIGRYAFASCVALVDIALRSTKVTTIGDSAFQGCTNLTHAALPNGLTTLGAAAFKDDTGLKKLEVGEQISKWGAGAFANCGGVTNLIFHGDHVQNLSCDVLADAFAPELEITGDDRFWGIICGRRVGKKGNKSQQLCVTGIASGAIFLVALIFVIIVKCLSKDTMEEPLLRLRSEGPEYIA